MLKIDGKEYYKITEAAELADVNPRTLRRWLQAGYLDHFMFPYKLNKNGPLYYRLEPPEESDELWDGENVYKLKGN